MTKYCSCSSILNTLLDDFTKPTVGTFCLQPNSAWLHFNRDLNHGIKITDGWKELNWTSCSLLHPTGKPWIFILWSTQHQRTVTETLWRLTGLKTSRIWNAFQLQGTGPIKPWPTECCLKPDLVGFRSQRTFVWGNVKCEWGAYTKEHLQVTKSYTGSMFDPT